MKLQQLVTALDAQVAQGDVFGAFQKYAADHCVTLSNDQDKTTSKAQKLEALRWFFDNIAATNRIELLASKVGADVTESQFRFDFTNRQGQPMVFDEVIRRTWQDGLVIEERYLAGASLEVPAAPKAAAAKKAVAPKVAVAKETAPKAAKRTAEPKADKKPATKSAKDKLTAEVKAGK